MGIRLPGPLSEAGEIHPTTETLETPFASLRFVSLSLISGSQQFHPSCSSFFFFLAKIFPRLWEVLGTMSEGSLKISSDQFSKGLKCLLQKPSGLFEVLYQYLIIPCTRKPSSLFDQTSFHFDAGLKVLKPFQSFSTQKGRIDPLQIEVDQKKQKKKQKLYCCHLFASNVRHWFYKTISFCRKRCVNHKSEHQFQRSFQYTVSSLSIL